MYTCLVACLFDRILTDKIGSISIQLASVAPCTVDSNTSTAAAAITTGSGSHSTRAGSGVGGSGAGSGGGGGAGGRSRSSSNASAASAHPITSPIRLALPPDHLTKCVGCRARKEWSRACKYLLIDLKLLLVVWTKTLRYGSDE